jgi:simple sugar transport system permease protein
MSEITQQRAGAAGRPADVPPGGMWRGVHGGARFFARQREATIFVVAVALFAYFAVTSSTFTTQANLVVLSQDIAPIIIIAIGEVLLLINGEIDLSVGFIYAFAPFLMAYMIGDGVPALPAILIGLLFGLVAGWFNGFLTVTLGLPSFIATLGTGFLIDGIMLITSHAEPVNPPASALGLGKWLGSDSWSMIIWAVILLAIFHVVLTRTRWGLHTVAAGGNLLGAREAGINVARIKYGNFMVTGLLGALVGIQISFQTSDIDPLAGGYQPMFYAVTAAVIGGTAMLGGSGTMIGALLGAIVLGLLTDGFSVIGISANTLPAIFGGAIIVAMIANVQLTRLRDSGRMR